MKQTDDLKDMAPQAEGTNLKEEVTLDDEQLDKVVGGTGTVRILGSINHCKDPKGKCKMSTQKDKMHAWTPYKKDYICIYCDKWVHPYEL